MWGGGPHKKRFTMKIDYHKVGLKAGLEIHQQLDTRTKLFCKCPTTLRDKKESTLTFKRYQRASKSEMGEVDKAALEEEKYSRTFIYKGYDSTCLVENDEQPPGELNREAIDISLEVALLLNMNPLDEIHTMRKIVIDGSNTCGFQRTALVAMGGGIETEEGFVAVDSLSLEEDAAQKIETEGEGDAYAVVYSLDRLGIPLVEIGTAPDIRTVEQARKVAEHLGMILRSTGKVKRGLGTIRQDINVSIEGGARVELKGVQNLRLIAKIVENEVIRQTKLIELREELKRRGAEVERQIKDLSSVFERTASNVIKLQAGGNVFGVCLRGFSGILGTELQPERRFGSELADFANKYGVGLMHTDELPAYGITAEEVEHLKRTFDATEADCVVIVAAERERAEKALKAVLNRAEEAMRGVPKETRRALPNGSSAYMRPLPGASRMYPETDVPPVEIDEQKLKQIKSKLPETFEHRKERYREKFGLNDELADKISRNSNFELFERIMESYENIPATLVVRTLTDTLAELMQEIEADIDIENLEDHHFMELFKLLSANTFGKEAVPDILKFLANPPEKSVERAIEEIGLGVDKGEVEVLIADIVNQKKKFIREKRERAVGPLMGIVMKELRGKVDGKVINKILEEKVKGVLEGG
uniref:Glutamyl-tRNA(Gln) amidotransferase subunit E n=1 Tax=Candidatus Methanophagaceae archaeon ANME-1 ERB6 TaxID=2759912 RepID=A0A7G9YXZ6_9EURY|nr:glutamyl-tRNA(Gln) amidotransferase subunit E [Methanosarcinales archaeon ANME-1 ERB6]